MISIKPCLPLCEIKFIALLTKDLLAIVNATATQAFLDFKEGIINNPGYENAFNTFDKVVAQATKWIRYETLHPRSGNILYWP